VHFRRISAYQNAQALFGASLPKQTTSTDTADKRKKPIPAPRSKIPQNVTTSSEVSKPSEKANVSKSSLHSRFFSKRSKTDLGMDGLAAYKAKKPSAATNSSNSKYPAPRVPPFHRPVPQKRSESSLHISEPHDEVVIERRDFFKRLDSATSDDQRVKPEVKQKPLFSTFKSQVSSEGLQKRVSKAVSESDLFQSLKQEQQQQQHSSDSSDIVQLHVSTVEPVSITVNSDTSSQSNEPLPEDEVIEEDTSVVSKLVIDIPNSDPSVSAAPPARAVLQRVDNSEDEDDLELDLERDRKAAKSIGKSEPLHITTQPLKVDDKDQVVEPMSEGADKSCSTSFDSNDDSSLLVDDHIPNITPMMDSSGESLELRTKSPSVSTMSRSPPSPEPGASPIRHVS
jgi:hypothetical protein